MDSIDPDSLIYTGVPTIPLKHWPTCSKRGQTHHILARQDGLTPAIDSILFSALDILAAQNGEVTVIPSPAHGIFFAGLDVELLGMGTTLLVPPMLYETVAKDPIPPGKVCTEGPIALLWWWGPSPPLRTKRFAMQN